MNEFSKQIFGFPVTVLIVIFKSGQSSSGEVRLILKKIKRSNKEASQGDNDKTERTLQRI